MLRQTKLSANQNWENFEYKVGNNLPIVTTNSATTGGEADINAAGTVLSEGAALITSYGFVWATSANPTISDNKVEVNDASFTGDYTDHITSVTTGTIHIRAYATNSYGTAYGSDRSVNVFICLAEGTSVTLADYSYKNIEDITYDDYLLVWNFDEGRLDLAKPVWMVKPFTAPCSLVKFSDGHELKTVADGKGHRVFNLDRNIFQNMLEIEIGTRVLTQYGEATLISKELDGQAKFYNVITNYHMNHYANGFLTSLGMNNLYPIKDMKFVKQDGRKLNSRILSIPENIWDGLRLAEQETIERNKVSRMIVNSI